jgi:radical SAM superfamily enzyme YgiQ (UPF0313 family)
MRILLIMPAADDVRVTTANPRALERAMLRFSVMPLTVVAALTPAEHEVTICDENVEPIDFNARVDVVGVTFMTAVAARAYEIAQEFHRRGVTTVAGGYHPTFRPDEAARYFDAVVVGEAEELWPRVLDDIRHGCLELVYRATQPCDPATIPAPRRDLTTHTARHYVTTNAVQVGRGCTNGCRYCSITAFHHRTYRTRPLTHVLAELAGVPRNFMFVDDNIIADPDYARRLFTAMAPLRKRWVSQCSLSIADDPALLTLARRAGCRGLFIGIETIDDRNLAAVAKECNDVRDYQRRIAAIRRAGIGVVAGVIVGMDNDDPGVFERTLRFLQQTGIDAVQVNIMTPLPGTPLYTEFEHAGRITDFDWSHYDFRHCVITPARMSAAQLQAGANWLIESFYRLDRILVRALRTWWTCGLAPAVLAFKLNLTYRGDVRRFGIHGWNPAARGAITAWEFAKHSPARAQAA